jgi:hypothetical protein
MRGRDVPDVQVEGTMTPCEIVLVLCGYFIGGYVSGVIVCSVQQWRREREKAKAFSVEWRIDEPHA